MQLFCDDGSQVNFDILEVGVLYYQDDFSAWHRSNQLVNGKR